MTKFLIPMLLILLVSTAQAAEKTPTDPLSAWWKIARLRVGRALKNQKRTQEALESPKWFEQPYVTVGRMPLIDACLARPLLLPDTAAWADRSARNAQGSLLALFDLADHLCNGVETTVPLAKFLQIQKGEEMASLLMKLMVNPYLSRLPAQVRHALLRMVTAVAFAHFLRNKAFAGLSRDESKMLENLLPRWFVHPAPKGSSVRAYTTDTTDCVKLLALARKIDFLPLLRAARVMARWTDNLRDALRGAKIPSLPTNEDCILFEHEASFGRVLVGGAGPNTYRRDCAVLVDLGGDDLYMNSGSRTSPTGLGATLLMDVSGNDRYLASGSAQGCAMAGVAVLVDMAGDDLYRSGHYSQGAALGGFAFFCDEKGDDVYVGDLGVQCFALLGYSVFLEGAGRDTYRCGAMGQASATTLGVAVMVEEGGDDTYRAGGKYGFYKTWDSSCAQGAASGLRPWPPFGKTTLYGGVGFLSEGSGNDTYHCYNIGQGASYLLSLGMLVDREGDDTYTGRNYTRGVGVHLSAGVCLDLAGNDLHRGEYGQNGMSLDRSAGVFCDLAGDDVYRARGSFGFSTKPRGFSLFLDARGDDQYGGKGRFFGFANVPYGEDAESTSFFFDFGGCDVYPKGRFGNNAAWTERFYGQGMDAELPSPALDGGPRWRPGPPPKSEGLPERLWPLDSPWTLARFHAWRRAFAQSAKLLDVLDPLAAKGRPAARREFIDVVRGWVQSERFPQSDAWKLAAFLDSEDRDLSILGLWAMGRIKTDEADLTHRAVRLVASSPSSDLRSMACAALGFSARPEAGSALRRALSDPSWPVRRQAVIACKERRDPMARDELVRLITDDAVPEVRARAAEALGSLPDPRNPAILDKALTDPAEIVRFYAARALLLQHSRIDALPRLFPLLSWQSPVLRQNLVLGFLRSFTGQDLPARPAPWQVWWKKAQAAFRLPLHYRMHRFFDLATRRLRDGDEDGAIYLYRNIRKLFPRHAGACRELGSRLNGRAWKEALSGKDLPKGLALARESVEAHAGIDNTDTLSVLLYLTGNREEAVSVLEKGIETFEKGKKDGTLHERLRQVRAGKLKHR